jgi:hypothetical protein
MRNHEATPAEVGANLTSRHALGVIDGINGFKIFGAWFNLKLPYAFQRKSLSENQKHAPGR